MMHAFKSFLSLWGILSVMFLLSTAALATSTFNPSGFVSSLMNCPGIFGYTGPTPPTTTCFTPSTTFFTQTTSFTFATPSVSGSSISLPPCVLENNTLTPLGCVQTTSSSHHSRPDHPHHSKPAHQTVVNPPPSGGIPPELPVPCSANPAEMCVVQKGSTYTVGPLPPHKTKNTLFTLPSKTDGPIISLPWAAVNPVPCAADPAMLCVSQDGQVHTVGTIRPRRIQDGIAEPTLSMSVSGNTVPYPPSLSPRPCTADSTYACLPFGTSEKTVGTLLPVGPGAPTSATTTPQTSLATSSGSQNIASTASQSSLPASSGFQNTASSTATTSQTSLAASSGFQNTATSTSQTSSVPLTTVTVVNATTTLPLSSSLTGTSASSSSSAPTTTSKSGSSRSIKTSVMLMLTCCIISLSANCLSMGCSPIASQKTTYAPSQKSISSKTFRLHLMLLFLSSVISLGRGQSITAAPSQPLVFGNISISTCTGASPDCLVVDGTTMELSASLTVTYITPTDTKTASIPPCVNGLTPPGCYIPTLTSITPIGSGQSTGVSVTSFITSSALSSISGPPYTCGANSSMMCVSIPTESSPAWNSTPATTSTTDSSGSSSSTSNRTSTSASQPTQKSQAMSLRKFQNPFLLLVGVIVASAFVNLFGSDEEPSKDKETDSAVEKKTQQV